MSRFPEKTTQYPHSNVVRKLSLLGYSIPEDTDTEKTVDNSKILALDAPISARNNQLIGRLKKVQYKKKKTTNPFSFNPNKNNSSYSEWFRQLAEKKSKTPKEKIILSLLENSRHIQYLDNPVELFESLELKLLDKINLKPLFRESGLSEEVMRDLLPKIADFIVNYFKENHNTIKNKNQASNNTEMLNTIEKLIEKSSLRCSINSLNNHSLRNLETQLNLSLLKLDIKDEFTNLSIAKIPIITKISIILFKMMTRYEDKIKDTVSNLQYEIYEVIADVSVKVNKSPKEKRTLELLTQKQIASRAARILLLESKENKNEQETRELNLLLNPDTSPYSKEILELESAKRTEEDRSLTLLLNKDTSRYAKDILDLESKEKNPEETAILEIFLDPNSNAYKPKIQGLYKKSERTQKEKRHLKLLLDKSTRPYASVILDLEYKNKKSNLDNIALNLLLNSETRPLTDHIIFLLTKRDKTEKELSLFRILLNPETRSDYSYLSTLLLKKDKSLTEDILIKLALNPELVPYYEEIRTLFSEKKKIEEYKVEPSDKLKELDEKRETVSKIHNIITHYLNHKQESTLEETDRFLVYSNLENLYESLETFIEYFHDILSRIKKECSYITSIQDISSPRRTPLFQKELPREYSIENLLSFIANRIFGDPILKPLYEKDIEKHKALFSHITVQQIIPHKLDSKKNRVSHIERRAYGFIGLHLEESVIFDQDAERILKILTNPTLKPFYKDILSLLFKENKNPAEQDLLTILDKPDSDMKLYIILACYFESKNQKTLQDLLTTLDKPDSDTKLYIIFANYLKNKNQKTLKEELLLELLSDQDNEEHEVQIAAIHLKPDTECLDSFSEIYNQIIHLSDPGINSIDFLAKQLVIQSEKQNNTAFAHSSLKFFSPPQKTQEPLSEKIQQKETVREEKAKQLSFYIKRYMVINKIQLTELHNLFSQIQSHIMLYPEFLNDIDEAIDFSMPFEDICSKAPFNLDKVITSPNSEEAVTYSDPEEENFTNYMCQLYP